LQFDVLKSPLTGVHLIEASAGTGKTYAIEGLFMRLLLERRLSVGEILVVTYTNAATAELRERIRARLIGFRGLLKGSTNGDSTMKKAAEGLSDRDEAVLRITNAIQGFDEAAIYTIHGFCARILRESAFECNEAFDMELVKDQDDLVKEAAEDFWRLNISTASGLFLDYALSRLSLQGLISLYRTCSRIPIGRILPEPAVEYQTGLEERYQETMERAARAWKREREQVEEILRNDKGLNRKSYPLQQITAWIEGMDRFLLGDRSWDSFPAKSDRLGSCAMRQSVKKGYSAPGNPFFNVWEEFLGVRRLLEKELQDRILGLEGAFLNFMGKELERRKTARNLAHFDDLLTRLKRALSEGKKGGLIERLSSHFKAVLIDEFQDTDPIQYEIFRRLFWGEEGALFLIGDPKQAIYGFRGADVFTYMEAGRRIPNRHTLLHNWRSQPRLVDAINALFGSGQMPFLFREIAFEPALAAEEKIHKELRVEEGPQEPFIFWLFQGNHQENEEKISKAETKELMCKAICSEIARLVSLGRMKRALLGDRPLEEGDMAVLVKTNREAEMIKGRLSRLRVPAVLHHMGSVLQTAEALEVQRLLLAIEHPSRQEILRAALATDLMGLGAKDMDQGVSEFWDHWVSTFRGYGEQWSSLGFMPMFRRLLSEHGVLPRLAAMQDGERRMTNLLHIAEILHRESLDKGRGIAELINWLMEKRRSDAQEEYQLRLESDERAVQIITVHRSKGLQYPIVFCPFMWDAHSPARSSSNPFMFHDDDGRVVLDLGSESRDENLEKARREALAEQMRLLYVALTRACSRCYLVWKGIEPGPLMGQLLAGRPEIGADEFSSLFAEVLKRARGAIRFEQMPKADFPPLRRTGEITSLGYKEVKRRIDHGPTITSFTFIKGDSPDARDLDRQELTTGAGILEGFPGGSQFGVFIHKLFEEADFARDGLESRRLLIRKRLSDFAIDPSWEDALLAMMEKVLSSPLPAHAGYFTLHDIEGRISEMEFFFPVKAFSSPSLTRVLEGYPFTPAGADAEKGASFSEEFLSRLRDLEIIPVKGFMRGFIDLVCRCGERYYIIDWKSNRLGDDPGAYGREGLEGAMSRHLYHLQYLIYTVALHRFLALRIRDYSYERNFGAVHYLFIRGMDGRGSGVYTARPPFRLIERLCEIMTS
jgi:exodeoxyribonuclease V beta subunit